MCSLVVGFALNFGVVCLLVGVCATLSGFVFVCVCEHLTLRQFLECYFEVSVCGAFESSFSVFKYSFCMWHPVLLLVCRFAGWSAEQWTWFMVMYLWSSGSIVRLSELYSVSQEGKLGFMTLSDRVTEWQSVRVLTEMKYKHRKLRANIDIVDARPTSQWLYFTHHTELSELVNLCNLRSIIFLLAFFGLHPFVTNFDERHT